MPGNHLKCIGGLADGEYRIVAEGQRDTVVYKLPPARFHVPRTAPSDTVSYQTEIYVVDRVVCGDESIEFLRPKDWTSSSTLRHILT
jgi:hypothetical protein